MSHPSLQVSDTKQLVRAFIVDSLMLDPQAAAFRDDDSFIGNQIIDSTSFLEVVTFLESQYDLRIPDEDMVPQNLDSLNAIAGYIARRLDDG